MIIQTSSSRVNNSALMPVITGKQLIELYVTKTGAAKKLLQPQPASFHFLLRSDPQDYYKAAEVYTQKRQLQIIQFIFQRPALIKKHDGGTIPVQHDMIGLEPL